MFRVLLTLWNFTDRPVRKLSEIEPAKISGSLAKKDGKRETSQITSLKILLWTGQLCTIFTNSKSRENEKHQGIYLSKGENHRRQPRDTRCPQGSRLGAIYLPAQGRSSKENIPASAKIACLVETGARVVSHSSHMYMAVMFPSADDFLHFCAHWRNLSIDLSLNGKWTVSNVPGVIVPKFGAYFSNLPRHFEREKLINLI